MSKLRPVLSQEEILEQIHSSKSFYNNTQNVEEPHINALLAKNDDELLAQIGYKPELKRRFSKIQAFGVAFSIMGLLPSIASIFAQGIVAGPAGFLWGWVISSAFIFCIGVSMAENGSSQPTSGGLYYWTNFYAPPQIKTVLSFVIGNTNSIALVGALCSVDYGFAQEILACVVVAKDGNFEITAAKTYGIFAGCVVLHILITCLSSKHCAWLQTTSIAVNLGLIALYLIAMPIGASGNFRSAKFVFTQFNNVSDWPIGWTQLSAAWLPAIWTIGAFDSVIHVSEEVKDAEGTIPFGILGSIGTCWGLGTVIIIMTLFCMQTNDFETQYLGTSFGFPVTQIIYDCLGKKWTIAIMVLIAFAQFLMGASILTAISRQIWAFARDNGLPFAWWIKKVNKKLSVPINAVWFGGIMSILIGLLVLIGSVAANALFTLYIAGNYVAWGTPTFLRLTFGRHKFQPGSFYLGKFWSPVVGWTSTIFIVFVFFMVMFPANKNPDKNSMNYTCVITPSVWILSLSYYWIYAHKIYHGPCKTLEVESPEDGSYEEVLDGVEASTESVEVIEKV